MVSFHPWAADSNSMFRLLMVVRLLFSLRGSTAAIYGTIQTKGGSVSVPGEPSAQYVLRSVCFAFRESFAVNIACVIVRFPGGGQLILGDEPLLL